MSKFLVIWKNLVIIIIYFVRVLGSYFFIRDLQYYEDLVVFIYFEGMLIWIKVVYQLFNIVIINYNKFSYLK